MPTKGDASTILFQADTEMGKFLSAINVLMAEAQNAGLDCISFPKNYLTDSHKYGQKAITLLNEIDKNTPTLPEIIWWTDGLTMLIPQMPTDPSDSNNYKVTLDAAKDINDPLLNQFQHAVHEAAKYLVPENEIIGGCKIENLKPTEGYAVSQFCTGLLQKVVHGKADVKVLPAQKHTIDGKQVTVLYPQVIDQTLGAHSVKVSTLSAPGDDNIAVAIAYKESGPGYADSQRRMQGVQIVLEKEGYKCTPEYPLLYCKGVSLGDELSRLATFFSLLLDGDNHGISEKKPKFISDYVWAMSGNLQKKYGAKTYAQTEQVGALDWNTLLPQYDSGDMLKWVRCRDRHHELEELIDIGKAPKPVKKEVGEAIIANAEEAIALAKANGWPWQGVASHLKQFKAEFAAKVPIGGINSSSDGIGNTLHGYIGQVLHATNKFANCDVSGNMGDVNAGALAYCQGVLKGTSATLTNSGHTAIHNVGTASYETLVKNENPDGSYDIFISLPSKDNWSESLRQFLAEHEHFTCKANGECKINASSVEVVREIALLLSNLKGAGIKLGLECGPKVLEMASAAVAQYVEAGDKAYLQTPMMENTKQWLDACKTKFGILPPPLPAGQQEAMDKIVDGKYGGCDFSNIGEAVPAGGVLVYCEGIRKNQETAINGMVTGEQTINHFYHLGGESSDMVADIAVSDLPNGKYDIAIAHINMKGNASFTGTVKNALTEIAPLKISTAGLSGQVNANELRRLAAFLSSLHPAYKIANKQCYPAIIDYVKKEVAALPESVEAHNVQTTKHTQAEWAALCAPVGTTPPPPAGPEGKPAPVTPTPIGGDFSEWLGGKSAPPSPPYKLGGCRIETVGVPTKLRQRYCAGTRQYKTVNGQTVPMDLSETTNLFPGTSVHWQKFGGVHRVGNTADGLPVVELSTHGYTLIVTLPPSMQKIKPLVEALPQHPFYLHNDGNGVFSRTHALPYASRIARFFSHLTGITMLPESCWQAAVDYAKAQEWKKAAVSPYDTEDWMSQVCKIETPEPVKPKLAWSDVPLLTEDKIASYITANCVHSEPDSCTGMVEEKFGILHSQEVSDFVEAHLAKKMALVKGFILQQLSDTTESSPWSLQDIFDAVKESYPPYAKKGMAVAALVNELVKDNLLHAKGQALDKLYWAKETEAVVKTITDLNSSELAIAKNIVLSLYDAGQFGVAPDKVAQELGIANDAALHAWAHNIATGGKKPIWELSDEQLASVKLVFCDDKLKGGSLDEALTWFVNTYTDFAYDNPAKNKLKAIYDKCPGPPTTKPSVKSGLDDLIKQELELTHVLYDKMSKADIEKAKTTQHYKKLPKSVRDWLHAVMDLHLLEDAKAGQTIEHTIAQLQKAIINPPGHEFGIPLTPKMVELQTKLEHEFKVKKGWLPPTKGEKVSKKYEDLKGDAKAQVDDEITKYAKGQLSGTQIVNQITKQFGLVITPGLDNAVADAAIAQMKAQQENFYENQDDATKTHIALKITDLLDKGLAKFQIIEVLNKQFGIENTTALENLITKLTQDYEVKYLATNHAPTETPEEIGMKALDFLKAHPNEKWVALKLDKEIWPGYAGNASISFEQLMKMAKEGWIHAQTQESPYLFWYAEPVTEPAPAAKKSDWQKLKDWIVEAVGDAGHSIGASTLQQMANEIAQEEHGSPDQLFPDGPPDVDQIKFAAEELIQEGKLLWEIVGNKYSINPSPMSMRLEKRTTIDDILPIAEQLCERLFPKCRVPVAV